MSLNSSTLRPSDTVYAGLRDWLEQVDRLGEVTTIRGADRDLEMAGIWEIMSAAEAPTMERRSGFDSPSTDKTVDII